MRMNILSKNRTLILLEDDLLDLEHLERQVVKVCQKNSINSLNVISFSQTPLALEALKRTPDVALLICDTFLPDIDAIGVLHFLKEDNIKTPVFLISGVSNIMLETSKEMGIALGQNVIGTAIKPMTQNQLENAFVKANLIS
jgi:response regulator of citrate/malate metabolism